MGVVERRVARGWVPLRDVRVVLLAAGFDELVRQAKDAVRGFAAGIQGALRVVCQGLRTRLVEVLYEGLAVRVGIQFPERAVVGTVEADQGEREAARPSAKLTRSL